MALSSVGVPGSLELTGDHPARWAERSQGRAVGEVQGFDLPQAALQSEAIFERVSVQLSLPDFVDHES